MTTVMGIGMIDPAGSRQDTFVNQPKYVPDDHVKRMTLFPPGNRYKRCKKMKRFVPIICKIVEIRLMRFRLGTLDVPYAPRRANLLSLLHASTVAAKAKLL
jgi:hypothetical protein